MQGPWYTNTRMQGMYNASQSPQLTFEHRPSTTGDARAVTDAGFDHGLPLYGLSLRTARADAVATPGELGMALGARKRPLDCGVRFPADVPQLPPQPSGDRKSEASAADASKLNGSGLAAFDDEDRDAAAAAAAAANERAQVEALPTAVADPLPPAVASRSLVLYGLMQPPSAASAVPRRLDKPVLLRGEVVRAAAARRAAYMAPYPGDSGSAGPSELLLAPSVYLSWLLPIAFEQDLSRPLCAVAVQAPTWLRRPEILVGLTVLAGQRF